MKKILVLLLAVLVQAVSAGELYDLLSALPAVRKIEKLDSGKFSERYCVLFEQPVDHKNPSGPKFTQRVVISHAGFERPTLIVTEGYAGDRALHPMYREEISRQLNTNQVFVEHRYFGVSVPQPRDWSFMTGENAAADLHAVKEALSKIYAKKWVASGISKGGQNTMIYATYWPEDVDAYVPYVGPVCRSIEDGRHEPFLASVGRQGERDTIMAVQKEILSRRAAIVPMVDDFVKREKLKFNAGTDEILDMCVLELSFSLWQWGTPVSSLPEVSASDSTLFVFLMKTVGPDYFQPDPDSPFFVQASADLGYYGYDVRPFKGLLSIKSAKGYMKRLMVPDDAAGIRFSPKLCRDINAYLKKNDPKMLFIYGGIDPWSSVMPDRKYAEGKTNMKFYIQPRGSHRTRINTQAPEVSAEIWATLSKWLDIAE